jgi:hypothetical protein
MRGRLARVFGAQTAFSAVKLIIALEKTTIISSITLNDDVRSVVDMELCYALSVE